MGLHSKEPIIEKGMHRVGIFPLKSNKSAVKKVNKEMVARSKKREELQQRWHEALEITEKMEVALEVELGEKPRQPCTVFINAIIVSILTIVSYILVVPLCYLRIVANARYVDPFVIVTTILVVGILGFCARYMVRFGNHRKRLCEVGKGVIKALKAKEIGRAHV